MIPYTLGSFKKRPHVNGAWIKDKECKLAHKILTYSPKFKTDDQFNSFREKNLNNSK